MSQVSPAAAAGKDGGQFSPSHRTGSHKSSIELDAKSVVPGKGFRPATVRLAGKPKDQDATQAAPTEQSVVRTRWKQLLRTEGPKHMGRDKERNVAKELKTIEHEHRVTKAGDVIKLSSVALSAIRRLRAARGSVTTGEPDVTELAEEMRRRRLTQRELMELDPEQLLARGFGIDDLTDELIVEHIVSSDCTATEVQTVFRSTLEKNRTQAFHLVVAETLIQKGEPLMAEEILYFATKRYKEDTQRRIRQLHGLALAQGGSTERAIVVLEQLQLEGAMDDEGGGLLARCYKDLAARERNSERRTALLNKAHAIYKEAFEAGGRSSYYTGINTATMAMLTGRTVEAIALADDVVAICRKELEAELKAARAAAKQALATSGESAAAVTDDCASEGGAALSQVASVSSAPHTDELVIALRPFFKPSHYWCLATIGEANVIIGDFEAAAEHYEAARECAGDSWVRIASTQRQLRLLLKHKVEAGLGPQALRALQKGEAGAFRAALAGGGRSADDEDDEDGGGGGVMSVVDAADEEAAGAARARLTAAVRSTMELHRASAKSDALKKRVLAVLYDTRRTMERQQQQRQPRPRGGRRQARRASLPETFSESIMSASLSVTGRANGMSSSFGPQPAANTTGAAVASPARSDPKLAAADSSSPFRPPPESPKRDDSGMRRRAQEAALMARDGPFACLMDIPTVAVFLACEADELYAVPSPGAEGALRKQLRQSLRACNARFAYCCPCTLADVLFLEVAAELGCEVYIVLPVPMDVHIAWCTTRFMDVEKYDVIASAPPASDEEDAEEDAAAAAAPRGATDRKHSAKASAAAAATNTTSTNPRPSGRSLHRRATSGESSTGARNRRRKRGKRKSLLFSTSALIQRLRDQLAAAARVDIANDMSPEMTVTNRHYASLLVDGLARKRAQLLGTATRRLYCHGEVMPSRLTVRSWMQRRPHDAEFPGLDGITASGIHLMPHLTAPGAVKEFACNLTAKGLFPGAEASLGEEEEDEDDTGYHRHHRSHDSDDDGEDGGAPRTAERSAGGRPGLRSPVGSAFGGASAEGRAGLGLGDGIGSRPRASVRSSLASSVWPAGLTPMEDESLYLLRSEAQHTVAVAAAHKRAAAIAKAVAAGAHAAGMQLSPGAALGATRPGVIGPRCTPMTPIGPGGATMQCVVPRQADRSPVIEGMRGDGSVMRGVSLAGNSMAAADGAANPSGLADDVTMDHRGGALASQAQDGSRSLAGPLSGFGAPRDSVGAESVPESAGWVKRFSASGQPDTGSPSAKGRPPVAVPATAGPAGTGAVAGGGVAAAAGSASRGGSAARAFTPQSHAGGRHTGRGAGPLSPAAKDAMATLATLFAAPLAVEHWITHATPFRVVVTPFSIRSESHEHLMAMLPAATIRKAHSAQRLLRRDRSASDAAATPTADASSGAGAKVSAVRSAKASSFTDGMVVASAVGVARRASQSQNPEVSVAAVMANLSEGGSGSDTGSRRDDGFTEEELQLAAKAQEGASKGSRWIGAASAASRAAAGQDSGSRPDSAASGAAGGSASGGRGVTFSEVVGRATVRSALDADLSRALELLVPAFQTRSGIVDARATAAGGDKSDSRTFGPGTVGCRARLFDSPAPSIRRQVIAAPLFADVVNFSKLSEPQVLVFIENVLGAIANLIDSMPPRARPRIQQTWGDALYGVWARVPDAGEFALMLSDLITKVPWHTLGLPSNLNIRISLHAAPVHVVTDPILRLKNYTGVHTSRAARIEPITPPGSVYCTQAFAAISEMLGVQSYECTYVGNVPLAKKYGMQPVFAVRWKSSSRTVPRRLHQRLRNTLRHLAGRARKDTVDEPPAKPKGK